MAYVVVRPKGRFEIRESVNTPKGPRARSLANFAVLTDEVLAQAAARATRPFDPIAVLAGADRAGVGVTPEARLASASGWGAETRSGTDANRTFVESSRRMAHSLERPETNDRPDPGQALIDLLGFAEQVMPFREPPPPEPLLFPSLARLVAARS
jgi:hypothetical protein